jgi:hypothetical protein
MYKTQCHSWLNKICSMLRVPESVRYSNVLLECFLEPVMYRKSSFVVIFLRKRFSIKSPIFPRLAQSCRWRWHRGWKHSGPFGLKCLFAEIHRQKSCVNSCQISLMDIYTHHNTLAWLRSFERPHILQFDSFLHEFFIPYQLEKSFL